VATARASRSEALVPTPTQTGSEDKSPTVTERSASRVDPWVKAVAVLLGVLVAAGIVAIVFGVFVILRKRRYERELTGTALYTVDQAV
jgi:hypothetical protein